MKHVACLFLFWFALQTSAQEFPASINKPQFKVGDYWVYNKLDGMSGKLIDVTSEELLKVDSTGYQLRGTEGFGTFVTTVYRNTDFNKMREIGEKKYLYLTKPFYPHFSFPLLKGKTWKGNVELTWSTFSDVKIVFNGLQSKVVGWEYITVPAGNFWTLRIESSGWNNGQNSEFQWGGFVTETLWFAPDLRNVIKTNYMEKINTRVFKHEVTELRSYGLTP